MTKLKLTQKERQVLADKIQDYCYDELDVELGQFDAGFLMDFVAEQIGDHFYNKGLQDAQAVFASSVDAVSEAMFELEKPVDFSR